MQDESDRLTTSIVEFCRFARENGLSAGVQQSLAALDVAKATGIEDSQTFAFALRAVLCSSKAEWDLFDRIFEAFWSDGRRTSAAAASKNAKVSRSAGLGPKPSSVPLAGLTSNEGSQEEEGRSVSGASAHQRLRKVDFSNVPYHDLRQLEEISLRLLRQMSQRLSRRLKIRPLAEQVDVRRTIRRSVPRGGDPIVLAYKGRKPRKNRLVILLDISGSMNSYSLFLLRFAYALEQHFQPVDTFLFSTTLVEVTDVLRTRALPDALRALSQRAAGWAGGTRIGESLQELNRGVGRKLLSRDTIFIILSDGWDTGEPAMLGVQLRRIRSRVQKLVWLNPLLGLKDYRPMTRGMRAALPYIDVFAPAHNLESLLALEKYL